MRPGAAHSVSRGIHLCTETDDDSDGNVEILEDLSLPAFLNAIKILRMTQFMKDSHLLRQYIAFCRPSPLAPQRPTRGMLRRIVA